MNSNTVNRLFVLGAFALGLIAVVWVGWGFVGTSAIALTMTLAIGAVYLLGAQEIRRYSALTAALAQALAEVPQPLAQLSDWLGRVPPGCVAALGVLVASPCQPDLAELDLARPWFVTIGTIEPRKNHALLLDVWQALSQRLPAAQMPQLVIAGSRGWRNEAVFRRLDARPAGVIEAAGMLLIARCPLGAVAVRRNLALKAGSSHIGAKRRASGASNWVNSPRRG